MMFLAYASLIFLSARLLVVLFNLLTYPVLKKGTNSSGRRVSVLIQARDEEERLPLLLGDLIQAPEIVSEILVYDDNSTDGTAPIIKRFTEKDRRLRYIEGQALPPGWLGKNHACHRLAQEARGDYLLFLDADVRVSPRLVPDSLAYLERHGLDLLSLFPVQIMRSFGEKITVPLINWVLLGLLPLWLVGHSRFPSLSAANGQFMLFSKDVYSRHPFHQMFRDNMVEDISIIRRMKSLGYRVQTLVSNGQVSCWMYKDYPEALNGLSKNVKAFFGNNWLLMLLYGILTSFGPLFVGLAMPLPVLWAYLSGLVLLRGGISFLSRQPMIVNTFLMPLQAFSFWVIMLRGSLKYMTGTLTWKGRPVRNARG